MSLWGGSFTFEADTSDIVQPHRIHCTLETTYRPHLSPRWCWRPFERYTVHTLHRHVLRGIAEEAQR
jgi:hypothetical protein